MAPARKPYRELQRKLVIAFDVGTTFSGASFALLDPGRVPTIEGVTRFPGQQETGGNSKIPSVICYDGSGNVLSVGQEAVGMHPEEEEDDEDEDSETWDAVTIQRIVKVEWFKLHLRPKALSAAHLTEDALPPLPFNKTAVEVFGDFLGYLYRCTRNFFEESMLSGKETWDAIEASGNIEFILTHPNGWEGPQQAQMREAAVRAGLVTNITASRDLIQFVSEGEASLHFCINKGVVARERLPAGDGVIIIDAGGGTIDLSAYKRSTDESFVEIAKTACILQGSVMVSRRANAWLRGNLQGSRFVNEIDEMTSAFDGGAKLTFRNPVDPSFIRFGSVRDRDPKFDIKSGQKKIPGSIVASFFEPSIRETIQAIQEQRIEAGESIKAALLVGGFAASDWVFSQLKSSLESVGIILARPDGHVNKAVADGAISFYLDHFVSARVSKLSYGTDTSTAYKPWETSHLQRRGTLYINAAGEQRIPGSYSEILSKGIQVSETKEYRRNFHRTRSSRKQLSKLKESVKCYRGDGKCPGFIDEEPDMFSVACTIYSPDMSQVVRELPTLYGAEGQPYYRLKYEVILAFGLTELKAQIAWKDSNGYEQRSPAEVIYDEEQTLELLKIDG